jgi:hypothetical protein
MDLEAASAATSAVGTPAAAASEEKKRPRLRGVGADMKSVRATQDEDGPAPARL